MSRAAIQPGQMLMLRGVRFTISQKLRENRWQLRNIETGEWCTYARDDLLSAFAIGNLIFEVEPDGGPSIDEQLSRMLERDLQTYPQQLVALAEVRQKYLKEIDRREPLPMTKESLRQIVLDVSMQIDDHHPPGTSTLHRSYRLWMQSGRDIRSLIPRIAGRGSHRRKFSPEVVRIIEENIDKIYLRPERSKYTDVHVAVKEQLERDNKFRTDGDKIELPSLRSISRAIAKRSPYDVMVKRYGKRAADNAFRCTGAGPLTTRPLERVQIDHTPADCIIVDEKTMLPLGRPTITTLLDEHTRCVLGTHIGFAPPSTSAIMSALKNAILPKNYLRSEFPSIVNDWPCFGVPWIIVCDNGKEFLGRHFQRACLSLGCDIQYTKPKVAYYKGAIERFQRSLNEENLHPARGTTLAKYLDLATDYDPRENAVITLHMLREELHRWIVDVYHRKVHGNSYLIPTDTWEKNADNLPIPLPPSVKELDIVLGRIQSGRVQHYGLQNEKLHYNSDDLGALRREHGLRLRVEFIWNEEDLGHIYVIRPVSGTHIQVPAIRYAYASGLTLHQHKTIEAFRRKHLKGRMDEAASTTAKTMIQHNLNQKLGRRSRKITKKEARYMYGGTNISPLGPTMSVDIDYSSEFLPPDVGSRMTESETLDEELASFPTEIVPVKTQPEK